MAVRVRYAPSPTGLQHIGGVRTALFNYFFARSQGGTFILRIEDTDRERFNERSLQDIYDTFGWLGIAWDEGPDVGGPHAPYFQSERTDNYRQAAEKLIELGYAYYAYDTPEELEAMRRKGDGYDRSGRDLREEKKREYEEQGVTPVVRFKVPLEGETSFEDTLLGTVTWKNEDIAADPILLKSDGFPTYHLANVVDDHEMEISHILRAQEWVPSAPLHVLMYSALGWEPPAYCHLPMVMGEDGQKLSKRHGATSLIDFRNEGYLPEALINYVTLLGWSYDDSREMFTSAEFEKLFSLSRLNKAPAVFDYKKLEWFNGIYVREKSDEELFPLVLPYLQEAKLVSTPAQAAELDVVRGSIPLIKERMKVLSDAPGLVRFLFQNVDGYDPADLIPKKLDAATTVEMLHACRKLLPGVTSRSDEENEELFRGTAGEMETKLGNLLMPLRVAVTGSRVSPPLFGSIRLLGEEVTLGRVDRAIEKLQKE